MQVRRIIVGGVILATSAAGAAQSNGWQVLNDTLQQMQQSIMEESARREAEQRVASGESSAEQEAEREYQRQQMHQMMNATTQMMRERQDQLARQRAERANQAASSCPYSHYGGRCDSTDPNGSANSAHGTSTPPRNYDEGCTIQVVGGVSEVKVCPNR